MIAEERPKQGGSWLGNSSVYERQRVKALEEAQIADEAGDAPRAAWWRERADRWRIERDREQAKCVDQNFRRSVFGGR